MFSFCDVLLPGFKVPSRSYKGAHSYAPLGQPLRSSPLSIPMDFIRGPVFCLVDFRLLFQSLERAPASAVRFGQLHLHGQCRWQLWNGRCPDFRRYERRPYDDHRLALPRRHYFSGDISEFSINQTTGALSPLPTSPVAAELGVDALVIDPTSKFLYAVSERSANLYEFSIDATGNLQALASSPVPINAGTTASRAIAMDPSGKYLFVSAEDSTTDNLYVFTRDLNAGTLTAPAAPVAIDVSAHAITTDPAGKFVLISSSGSSTLFGHLSVFSLDSATGALTPATGSPFPTGVDPGSVTVDPSGKFVYTANTADSTISAFSLNSTTGVLSPITGSPFPSGGVGTINGPTGIAAEPSGRFVYVCNSSNDISGFQINSQTGGLTAITSSPFASGANGPHAIVAVKKK
jgi:6-phosphogluconolactonase (cycloisomerase 2 family)